MWLTIGLLGFCGLYILLFVGLAMYCYMIPQSTAPIVNHENIARVVQRWQKVRRSPSRRTIINLIFSLDE